MLTTMQRWVLYLGNWYSSIPCTVCLAQIKFCASFSSLHCSKQVFHLEYGVIIQFGHWVDCHQEITTHTHTLFVSLFTKSCPVGIVNCFQGSFCHQPDELIFYLLAQWVWQVQALQNWSVAQGQHIVSLLMSRCGQGHDSDNTSKNLLAKVSTYKKACTRPPMMGRIKCTLLLGAYFILVSVGGKRSSENHGMKNT